MTNERAVEILNLDLDILGQYGGESAEAYKMAIKALDQRWIPVSEKMPDINIHVLAQFVMGGMAECYYAHNWWHIVGGFRISGDEVIAWMPLPEPYREDVE